MITASQIANLRTASRDYAETERLKERFARVRRERNPLYLTKEDFEKILRWKLAGQYNRGRKMREVNTEEVIRTVTGVALSISHADRDYEIELRVGILAALRGVGVPVASAVLALVFPEEYAVIDFRSWRQVFGAERPWFSIGDYKRYMDALRPLAEELGWPVQEVDLAIWAYDNELNPSARSSACEHEPGAP